MSKRKIQTPTTRYWKMTRSPFRDLALDNSRLGLFSNREQEMIDLHETLDCQISGIHGSYGVGKTSLLNKFGALLKKETDYCVLNLSLATAGHSALYRSLLKFILFAGKEKEYKVKSSFKVNFNNELQRINSTVSDKKGYKAGGYRKGRLERADSRKKPAWIDHQAWQAAGRLQP